MISVSFSRILNGLSNEINLFLRCKFSFNYEARIGRGPSLRLNCPKWAKQPHRQFYFWFQCNLSSGMHVHCSELLERSRIWLAKSFFPLIKGELQRENKLISYEREFKMLENDMYIAGIGQVVLELLSFKVESGNHQRGISLLQKFSDILGNMRLVPLKMTSHLTSHNFQILKIEIFSKLCKI